eukprot:TRINITY_DN18728_c0_g1_i1.p1 TRINITY_DN18728_c0_g1~~TRINITY_DN18728_c0_g1_i1.p1  ORF type:complete len:220 (-),score=40.47 TRINITY_DN18728_c0_g1_i1:70-729(-)
MSRKELSKSEVEEIVEEKIRRIFNLTYNTRVPFEPMEKEVMPYIHPDVGFTDGWQEGRGKPFYSVGMRGFHSLCNFDCDIFQSSVSINKSQTKGRAIVDGVMNIHLTRFWTYPLRIIIVYQFELTNINSETREVKFLIKEQEEMWSFSDMITAFPVVGYLYRLIFRRVFAQGFLLACRMGAQLQTLAGADVATGKNWNQEELKNEPSLASPSGALPNLW